MAPGDVVVEALCHKLEGRSRVPGPMTELNVLGFTQPLAEIRTRNVNKDVPGEKSAAGVCG
jgi:hypothetical protein